MSSDPILPKTFAAYVHPLQAKKHYTAGSDGQSGLSAAEVKRIKTDIALSQVLSPEHKQVAAERVDQARLMTIQAMEDGRVDATEQAEILALARHSLGQATGSVSLDLEPAEGSEFFRVAAGTSYAPHNTRLEGGPLDCRGNPLETHTLEHVLENIRKGRNGPQNYVAVAMDSALFRGKNAPCAYGDLFRIPELEAIYQTTPIYFALVDTGGAFKGTHGAKIDICCQSPNTPRVNQSLSLHRLLGADGRPLNIADPR
jgi:hypothetical protein